MLQIVFTRLEVQFRRATVLSGNPDSDLYQWFQGSKLCLGDIESLITLNDDEGSIDVKVRGTNLLKLNCFYFLDEILDIINQALKFIAPGLLYKKYIFSSKELKTHVEDPTYWSSEHIFRALLSPSGVHSTLFNPNIKEDESILQLIGFGCENVPGNVVFGNDISVKKMPRNGLETLAQLLDPKDPYGKDWCLLAVKLDLSERVATLDNDCTMSRTLALIKIWCKSKNATVGNLFNVLMEIGREDAASTVTVSAPLYKIMTFPENQYLRIEN
ncbi:hypothetical protein RUM44_002781 [Polyplax serrata]|uniref:Death domain-containing protein n=1 Tax=Polyplax serrata TaxID=468196 RepID=A0ABR1AFP5_POLSC